MSIERKDLELEKTERSSKLFSLSLRENDHIVAITENIKSAKERIIEYAKDLALRIDLKDEKLEITEYYQICTYIRRQVSTKLDEVDEHKIKYVNDCLEDFPEYKDHRYDKLTKGSVNRSLENLITTVKQDLKELSQDNLDKIAESDPLELLEIEELLSVRANKAKNTEYSF